MDACRYAILIYFLDPGCLTEFADYLRTNKQNSHENYLGLFERETAPPSRQSGNKGCHSRSDSPCPFPMGEHQKTQASLVIHIIVDDMKYLPDLVIPSFAHLRSFTAMALSCLWA